MTKIRKRIWFRFREIALIELTVPDRAASLSECIEDIQRVDLRWGVAGSLRKFFARGDGPSVYFARPVEYSHRSRRNLEAGL